MKCRIIKSVSPEQVAKSVPPTFRRQLQARTLSSKRVTILLFPHDRRNVVHSRQVEKALASLDDSAEELIALAGAFTEESIGALAKAGAEIYTLSDFKWTDASHENIKVFCRAAVKRPIP